MKYSWGYLRSQWSYPQVSKHILIRIVWLCVRIFLLHSFPRTLLVLCVLGGCASPVSTSCFLYLSVLLKKRLRMLVGLTCKCMCSSPQTLPRASAARKGCPTLPFFQKPPYSLRMYPTYYSSQGYLQRNSIVQNLSSTVRYQTTVSFDSSRSSIQLPA